MSKNVNIEVYCEEYHEEKDVFGVVSEHNPDLPIPFDAPLQEWVKKTFTHLEIGDELPEAGTMIYDPYGDIIKFKANQ